MKPEASTFPVVLDINLLETRIKLVRSKFVVVLPFPKCVTTCHTFIDYRSLALFFGCSGSWE